MRPLNPPIFLAITLLVSSTFLVLALLSPVTAAPDFTISATPSSTTGPGLSSTVTLTSLNGFSGNVNVSAFVNPLGPSISLTSVVSTQSITLSLSSGGSASTPLFGSSWVRGNYTITVTATSGPLSHSIPVYWQATPPPADFSIDCCFSTGQGDMGRVSSGDVYHSWGWITSLNHFSGTVTVTVVVNLPTQIKIGPTEYLVPEAGTYEPAVDFSVPIGTPQGSYSGSITATNGSITHSTALSLTIDPAPLPCPSCFQDSWWTTVVASGGVLFASILSSLLVHRGGMNSLPSRIFKALLRGLALASSGVIAAFASGLVLVSQGWIGLTCAYFWSYGAPFAWRQVSGCGRLALRVDWSYFMMDALFYAGVGFMLTYILPKIWLAHSTFYRASTDAPASQRTRHPQPALVHP